MQKILLVVVMTLLCHTTTFARLVQGYFINLTDDTVKVKFDIPIAPPNTPNVRLIHFGVRFLDSNGQERELKPHQAKEFCFQYNNETTRLISRIDHLNLEKKLFKKNKTYVFLKLEVEGKLRLYSFYYTQHVNMDFSYESKFMIFQKGSGLLYLPKRTGFRKALMKYLVDCPDVYQRLKLKMYGKGDELEIVKDYNDKCIGRA
jgi:hypothetical protein